MISIVETVLFCGKQGIALRGHTDNRVIDPSENYFATDRRYGNFNAAMFLRISGGDAALSKHLSESNQNAKFCTSDCQNELIGIAGSVIQNHIIARVKKARFYAVLADGTTDVSHIDQFSMVLRYCLNCEVHEDFLDFVDVSGKTTGEALAETILQWLKKFDLDPENMRGQGYDGAANMTGVYKGVKSRLQETYPKALFTHCAAHVLNLVLGDSCSIPAMKNMFGTVGEIAVFFSESSKRTAKLEEHIPPTEAGCRLPLLCQTRWASRYVSVDRLWVLMQPVWAALTDLAHNEDARTMSKAAGLKGNIDSFQCLVCLGVAKHLLELTAILSQQLQSTTVDFVKAMTEVSNLMSVLSQSRENLNDSFKAIYAEVTELAEKMGIEEAIPRRTGRQTHRSNIPSANAEDYYRISVAAPFLDHVMTSLDERFSGSVRQALVISQLLPRMVVNSTENFTDTISLYRKDLPDEGRMFLSELTRWKSRWAQSSKKPSTIMQTLQECDEDYYPCIYTLLSIFAVIPVSVAECKRSFSALKRLKNYLRNTMGQDRLVGLALLHVHSDVSLSPKEIADKFLSASNRRTYC